eukprot:scaffold9134_cov170-Amphora_coffeaeformis.AAC.12
MQRGFVRHDDVVVAGCGKARPTRLRLFVCVFARRGAKASTCDKASAATRTERVTFMKHVVIDRKEPKVYGLINVNGTLHQRGKNEHHVNESSSQLCCSGTEVYYSYLVWG